MIQFRGGQNKRIQTMRKNQFTEKQIIAILAEQERGMTTADVCRRHGVSSATFYKCKANMAGWTCRTPAS